MLLAVSFLIVVPLGLAFIGYLLLGRFGLQAALGLLVTALCLIPGLVTTPAQPGSTWQGYAVIIGMPFLCAMAGMAVANRLSTSKVTWLFALAGIPILYWVGVAIGISLVVTAGWASP